MVRSVAFFACLLLLALGTASAARRELKQTTTPTCREKIATCTVDLRLCREKFNVRIAAVDACTAQVANCTAARNTCNTGLAVATKDVTACRAHLTTANTTLATCKVNVTVATIANTKCQATLVPLQTELAQSKDLTTSTFNQWQLSTQGKDMDDISASIEFIFANLDKSPKFKEQASVLNQLTLGIQKCRNDYSAPLALLGGLTSCLNTLLKTVGV